MREIKFRIFLNKKFYYWGFIKDSFVGLPTVGDEDFSIKEKEERSQQFTGLFDKNKKPIFEGDILKVILPTKKSYIGQVQFDYGQFWCVKHNGYGGEGFDFDYLTNKDRYSKIAIIEIIGNVYEGLHSGEKTKLLKIK